MREEKKKELISKGIREVEKNNKIKKYVRIAILVIMLILLILYTVMRVIYNRESFSISLDKTLYYEQSLIIYDDPNYKVFRAELEAESVDTFDNISYKWLPEDLNDGSKFGSHNGDDYIAYTFFIENTGENVTNYWGEVIIDDVIKNVDEAVRLRIYKTNDVKFDPSGTSIVKQGEVTEITYAKANGMGNPEDGTVAFESDNIVYTENENDFEPGDIDKYTVVIWIEGNDPDCTDNILGGEIKMHMSFNSEFVD